jgi:RNA polymerase sigma-70 factor (ECF subfamily)
VITRSKIQDLRRRRQNQPEAEGGSAARQLLQEIPEPADAEGDDEPQQVQSLHHRALELVRCEFEDRTWQAFWRCAVEGQSPADIARDMHITPAAVRQAKSRVLRRLKEEFGAFLG